MSPRWLSTVSRLGRAFVAGCVTVALAASCAPDQPPQEPELEFGLGSKADEICDAAQPLCWDSTDSATMSALLSKQDEVVFGEEPREAVREMVDFAWGLAHKMEPPELAALTELEQELADIEPRDYDASFELVHKANVGPLERVIGTYYVAYMVPTGRAMVASANGRRTLSGYPSDHPGDRVRLHGLARPRSVRRLSMRLRG